MKGYSNETNANEARQKDGYVPISPVIPYIPGECSAMPHLRKPSIIPGVKRGGSLNDSRAALTNPCPAGLPVNWPGRTHLKLNFVPDPSFSYLAAFQTLSGVVGISLTLTPMASRMAFPTAGATPSIGISATAFTPKG